MTLYMVCRIPPLKLDIEHQIKALWLLYFSSYCISSLICDFDC